MTARARDYVLATVLILQVSVADVQTAAAQASGRLSSIERFAGRQIHLVQTDGSQLMAVLVRASDLDVTVSAGGREMTIDVNRVRAIAIRGDSVKDGAAIGAALGLLPLILDPFKGERRRCEPRSCVGRTILDGAVGIGALAAAGAWIDSRRKGATVIYRAPAQAADFNGLGVRTNEIVDGASTTYAPDARGNVASVTNENGDTTNYQYAWGLVRETTTPAYSVSRTINEDSTVASETRAGRTTRFAYDALFRPTTIQPPGGTNATLTEYDNVGGAWVNTTRGGSWLKTIVDGFGRPVQTDNSVGVQTLTEYDALGRVTKRTNPPEPNRQRQVAGGTARDFTYDENGNLTSRTRGTGAANFTYTPENLVAGVTTAAGASAYTYDADQWRVKRVTGNQVSYFLRGPTGELLCEWRPGAATETIR